MQLSADQMRSLTQALGSHAGQEFESERRRIGRLGISATVQVAPIHNGRRGETLTLNLQDLSQRGVGLFHTRAFDPGQQFILTLPRQGGPDVSFLCTTVHSRPSVNRRFIIGAEFTCVVSGETEPPAELTAEQDRIRQSILF